MSQLRRFAFAAKRTIALALGAVVYYQLVVLRLIPYARNEGGVMTWVLDILEFVVPLAIGIVLLVTWIWVFVAPVQEEQVEQETGIRTGGRLR